MAERGREVSRAGALHELKRKAQEIRRLTTDMFAASGGHYGGCLSEAEILAVLYFRVLSVNPERPKWADRDRFVISKGHGAAGLYATLSLAGFFPVKDLATYNALGSSFGMHPDMNKVPGVDMSTGSLGLGISAAVGMALAGKVDARPWRVFALVGDGECHEGIVWEAAMAAGHHRLDNMTVIVDRNGHSMDGPTESVMTLEPLEAKWRSFGWEVRCVDGHSVTELADVLEAVPLRPGRPTAVIARTVKGRGVPFMENKSGFHHAVLSPERQEEARKALAE